MKSEDLNTENPIVVEDQSHNIRALSDDEIKPDPNQASEWSLLYVGILVAIGVLLLSIPIGIYAHKAYKRYQIRKHARYIPQPFVQNYEFRAETLDNGLEALYVKLNQNKKKAYVGKIISSVNWCWKGVRSS